MATEGQPEYFIDDGQAVDGSNQIVVFYAPVSTGISGAVEVLRAKGRNKKPDVSLLWTPPKGSRLVMPPIAAGEAIEPSSTLDTGKTPTFEPSSIVGVGSSLDEFLRTEERSGVFVHDGAPRDIKDAFGRVVEAIKAGRPGPDLESFFGMEIELVEDKRPWPGQYI